MFTSLYQNHCVTHRECRLRRISKKAGDILSDFNILDLIEFWTKGQFCEVKFMRMHLPNVFEYMFLIRQFLFVFQVSLFCCFEREHVLFWATSSHTGTDEALSELMRNFFLLMSMFKKPQMWSKCITTETVFRPSDYLPCLSDGWQTQHSYCSVYCHREQSHKELWKALGRLHKGRSLGLTSSSTKGTIVESLVRGLFSCHRCHNRATNHQQWCG